MAKIFHATAIVMTAFLAPVVVHAADVAFSTADTDLGTLLDNPATKAILLKYIPGIVNNPQIEMARGMTLRALQQYAGSEITDEKLSSIDKDFKSLNAH